MQTLINAQVVQLAQQLIAQKWSIATAESCTGGGLAYYFTALAGSSAWFERGFVTYSNTAKIEMLGVKSTTLATAGAVSAETANEMAYGTLEHSPANLSISITGIAGPDGATAAKPLGTVWLGSAQRDKQEIIVHEPRLCHLDGNRLQIREQTILAAVKWLLEIMQGRLV